LTGTDARITTQTYVADEVPYSRAVFSYGIERGVASIILKSFLLISLIIIVSLASLLKKKTDTPIEDSEKKILNFPDFPKKK
jgi:hypothetical protein